MSVRPELPVVHASDSGHLGEQRRDREHLDVVAGCGHIDDAHGLLGVRRAGHVGDHAADAHRRERGGKELGLQPTAAQLNDAADRIKKQNNITNDAQFRATLDADTDDMLEKRRWKLAREAAR